MATGDPTARTEAGGVQAVDDLRLIAKRAGCAEELNPIFMPDGWNQV